MGKNCFFIGHRDAGQEIATQLQDTIERHIVEFGVTSFYVGRYGSFDAMATQAVIQAKKRHPEVELVLLLPYHPFDHPVTAPEGVDRTLYPSGMESVPKRLAIIRANHWMVDHSNYLIAYVWHPASNARNLLDYAIKREHRGLIHVTQLSKVEMER